MSMPTEGPADERVRRAVMRAISAYTPIRALDMDTMQVEVHQGVVVLRGLVSSDASRFAAERLARSVAGITKVENQLVTDEGLERRIAVALASDEATRHLRVVVNAEGGVVGLYGAVPSQADAEAARGVALGVAGIVGVESKLEVVPPGTTVILAWQNSIEGRPFPTPSAETAGANDQTGESPSPAAPQSPSAPPAPAEAAQ